jgi:hypothetical protein
MARVAGRALDRYNYTGTLYKFRGDPRGKDPLSLGLRVGFGTSPPVTER